jgi:hypothetical protein
MGTSSDAPAGPDMTFPRVLRPEAQADLVNAQAWYEQQRAGLGSALIDAVQEVLAPI